MTRKSYQHGTAKETGRACPLSRTRWSSYRALASASGGRGRLQLVPEAPISRVREWGRRLSEMG